MGVFRGRSWNGNPEPWGVPDRVAPRINHAANNCMIMCPQLFPGGILGYPGGHGRFSGHSRTQPQVSTATMGRDWVVQRISHPVDYGAATFMAHQREFFTHFNNLMRNVAPLGLSRNTPILARSHSSRYHRRGDRALDSAGELQELVGCG
jgi:hypothetical protein